MKIGIVGTMARTPRTNKHEAFPPARRGRAAGVTEDATQAASLAFLRAGFPDASLVLRWREIAGPEIARIARPLRFQETPSGGLLTLLAEPGAALFLGHDARALVGRVNAYLGRSNVARVKFVQRTLLVAAPRPGPVFCPGAEPKADDPVHHYQGPKPLEAALKSLARWPRSR